MLPGQSQQLWQPLLCMLPTLMWKWCCAARWEARIGIPGSKHIYLGLFHLEKEAAQAYDRALVRLRGTAAATNFALSDYRPDLAEYHKMQQAGFMSPTPIECLERPSVCLRDVDCYFRQAGKRRGPPNGRVQRSSPHGFASLPRSPIPKHATKPVLNDH